MEGQILFITDGSASAGQAGEMAIGLANLWRVSLRAVYILDEGWRDILGDEWISTPAARAGFYRWLEGGLTGHAHDILQKFAQRAAESGVWVTTDIIVGKAEKTIAVLAESATPLLLVLPNPNATLPPAEGGFQFNIRSLTQKIKCPVLIGPNPPRTNSTGL